MIVEPFAGSASLIVARLGLWIKEAIAADADPSVRVMLDLYRKPQYHEACRTVIRDWQAAVANHPVESWKIIKDQMQKLMVADDYEASDIPYLVAISYVYRSLAFAGIVRTGKTSNKINVSAGRDQVSTFSQRRIFFPTMPSGCNLDLFDRWQDAITAIPRLAKAFVLIDPPYYGKLEPCYPNHRPQDSATLRLFLDSLQAALDHPGVYRVVGKNYGSDEMDREISKLRLAGWHLSKETKGRMRVTGKGGRKTQNIEMFWYFDKDPRYLPRQIELI